MCRDVCPENDKLLPVPGLMAEPELFHPKLLEIIDLDDMNLRVRIAIYMILLSSDYAVRH